MSVHPSRRRGPLPADIEFACLDGASSGWSEIEQRRGGKGKGREGEVEIVPSVRMPVIQGLDGVSWRSFPSFALDTLLLSEGRCACPAAASRRKTERRLLC